MKKINILLILFSTIAFCQEQNQLSEKKGKFFLSAGTDYRITPIYGSAATYDKVITSIDLQNSGTSLNYSLDYYISKNFSLGFSQSFKYDVLLYNDDTSFNFGARKAEKAVLIDYHFYLKYYLKISKVNKLFFKFGKSLMNRGSEYSYVETFYQPNGLEIGKGIGQEDFSFSATNIGIGFNRKELELSLGMYASNNTQYFEKSQNFKIVYINLNYQLFKL